MNLSQVRYDIYQQYSRIYFSTGLIFMTPLGVRLNNLIQGETHLSLSWREVIAWIVSFGLAFMGYNIFAMSVGILERYGKGLMNV